MNNSNIDYLDEDYQIATPEEAKKIREMFDFVEMPPVSKFSGIVKCFYCYREDVALGAQQCEGCAADLAEGYVLIGRIVGSDRIFQRIQQPN